MPKACRVPRQLQELEDFKKANRHDRDLEANEPGMIARLRVGMIVVNGAALGA